MDTNTIDRLTPHWGNTLTALAAVAEGRHCGEAVEDLLKKMIGRSDIEHFFGMRDLKRLERKLKHRAGQLEQAADDLHLDFIELIAANAPHLMKPATAKANSSP